MCGIAGIYSFTPKGKAFHSKISNAVDALKQRGPDANGIMNFDCCALGHTRLSVIDTSTAASQPFTDISERYTIVFNGEFYNYQEHRKNLEESGVKFKSTSDTEVLLYMYIAEGADFIKKVNGCFAIAIFDKLEEKLFLARDRFGKKPLIIYTDADKIIFASEMKAIMAFGIDKKIDKTSLYQYFQLNYIPSTFTIFENVNKLTQGNYLLISKEKIEKVEFYKIPYNPKEISNISYEDAKQKLCDLLDASVKRRLVSDVPLGAFLSGGIDSSVVVSIASKYVEKLKTFSIGYKDEPFFDETNYANLVAKKFNTEHTVFKLTNEDLFKHFNDFLDYIDEPFADSSALAVFILSKETKKHVTVALSGDGADELLSGYNKHSAHLKALNGGILNSFLKNSSSLLGLFPKSRNHKILNKIRQAHRFSLGLNLSDADRYWRWCSLVDEKDASEYFKTKPNFELHKNRKNIYTNAVKGNSISEIFYADFGLVLPSDMLFKVDMMSMANGLEVRVPFLDYTVVDFVFSLPDEYKIDANLRKKILQDAYRDVLPAELYNRPKHGFEVPLLKWFKSELNPTIERFLSEEFIDNQNIFDYSKIEKIKKQLYSNNPNEVQAQIWALLIFQNWWEKNMTV